MKLIVRNMQREKRSTEEVAQAIKKFVRLRIEDQNRSEAGLKPV